MKYKSSLGAKDYEKISKLAQARGNGSSYRGSKNWMLTKMATILFVPAAVYLFLLLLCGVFNSYLSLVNWLSNPLTTTLLILSLFAIIMHCLFETLEAVKDYVHNNGLNFLAVLLIKGIFGFLALLGLISIIFIALA